MLAKKVIRPSDSPFAAPVVMAPKPRSDKLRFCVDYRELNKATVTDSYPMPRLDECLDPLGGSKFFTAVDADSGYWQVQVHPDDVHKTAFSSRFGLYEFPSMPFGLKNAPATFQRAMRRILSGMEWRFVQCYIDDILIHSKSWEDHLLHIDQVFTALKAHGVRLKWEKCEFAKDHLRFLGHIINLEGVKPDPDKVKCVADLTPEEILQSVKNIRHFLGLTGFYRRFIYQYAEKAKPLQRYLATDWKDKDLWAKHDDLDIWSIEQLKAGLCDDGAPLLVYPDWEKPFYLHVDAGNLERNNPLVTATLGAVLVQLDDEGLERPIGFASRKLNPAEENYSVTELEALAVVWAAKAYRPYIFGYETTVYTDHAALCWLLANKISLHELLKKGRPSPHLVLALVDKQPACLHERDGEGLLPLQYASAYRMDAALVDAAD